MLRIIKHIFLPYRFFLAMGIMAVLFIVAYLFQPILPFVQALFTLLALLTVVDAILLFYPSSIVLVERKAPKTLSLGDTITIGLEAKNLLGMPVTIDILDELPMQLQERKFRMSVKLAPEEEQILTYEIRPTSRGVYSFGSVNVYSATLLGLVQRREVIPHEQDIAVYPSIIQMKKYELHSALKSNRQSGIKKIRRIGHHYEFETIKPYVAGDDYRTINWKATSRSAALMVNQYDDEKSQNIYAIIDKSRSMKLPFDNLTLLDYSINSSLVIANTALQKHDKAGLITFSKNIDSFIRAGSGAKQLSSILQQLYGEKETSFEANYEILYEAIKKQLTQRSLLFLYSNFESYSAVMRVLPILRKIAQRHILILMIFKNNEIENFADEKARNLEDIYLRSIARDYIDEKYQIQKTLEMHGVHVLINKPEDLSINSINKYLELKARGLI